MKITKREQMLLGILVMALLGYCFYNFVYIKQIQNITELKTSKNTYSQKWEQAKVKIASKGKIKEKYKTLNAKIFNETDKLFPSIQQEEIIVILDKMIKDSNLQTDVLSFSKISSENPPVDPSKTTTTTEDKTKKDINEIDKLVSDFNGNNINDASSEKTNTDTTKVDGAYKMQVTFNFKGGYDELTIFINQVEDYNKKIVINDIKLTGTDGSNVSGTIILDFYGVPKLKDVDELKWEYKAPSGSGNPFVGSSTSLQGTKQVTTNNTESVQENNDVNNTNEITTKTPDNKITVSDFIMTAKPIKANLHTVTVQKSKDESKQSYLYSDNEKIEQVEFYFTKVGAKYFYKYKTGLGSYPENFSNPIEFVPNGEKIILDIVSQKRGLDSDLSGVNIKITNDTDNEVSVNILDDDKNKPRVKVIKEKGSISVVRNYIYYIDK